MTDETDLLLSRINEKTRVVTYQGTFVSASTTGYVVNVGGGQIPAALGSTYLPEVGEQVWVWLVDTTYFVMGPVAAKPDRGTVVAVGSGLVNLTTALGTVVAPYGGTTPSAGQIMKLMWHGGPYAVSVMSTSPAGNTPPAGGGSTATSHSDEFAAIDTGSYRAGDGWWTDTVRAGDTNLGLWFYGSQVSDTIPSNATITRVQLYLSIQSTNGVAANFATHPYQSKPGGSPSLGTVASIVPTGGLIDLPLSVGNALKAGGGSAGVGVNHGGNTIFNSRTGDGFSGRLIIKSTY